MNTKISTIRTFSVHTISRVRLELETVDGSTQLFDEELRRPEDAEIDKVTDVLVKYGQRINVLTQQKFVIRAKLTVTSASGAMIHVSEDLASVIPVFDMASKLLNIRK